MTALPSRTVILAFIVFTSLAWSQAPAPTPSFEVASIRQVPSHTVAELQRSIGVYSTCTYPTARYFAHNVPLTLLIAQAYGLDVKKAPDWGAQLYDIDANVEGGRALTRDEIKPLLQALLMQRLHLQVHQESEMVSGYKLVIAKRGPKLQPAKEGSRPNGFPAAFHAQVLPNGLDGWGIPVATLAHILSGPAGSPVVDGTGIPGSYDVHLSFAPSNDQSSSLPSIFTAVQEQLGLKLESAKVPVEYVVVDHVDRQPTEN
jgi:uncharacterized protein (TIGR03435 family)